MVWKPRGVQDGNDCTKEGKKFGQQKDRKASKKVACALQNCDFDTLDRYKDHTPGHSIFLTTLPARISQTSISFLSPMLTRVLPSLLRRSETCASVDPERDCKSGPPGEVRQVYKIK